MVCADMEGVDGIGSTRANGGWTDETSAETYKWAPRTITLVLVVQSVVNGNSEQTPPELLCIDGDWLIEETSTMSSRSVPSILIPPHFKHGKPVISHEEHHPVL